MTPYKHRQATYVRFRDNWEIIPAWRSDLDKSIMLTTFNFLEFIPLCVDCYDLDRHVVMCVDKCRVLFYIFYMKPNTLIEMLMLPKNHELLEEQALVARYQTLN